MSNSQWRIRPGFVLGLVVVFVIFPLFVRLVLPNPSGKIRAKIYFTRLEITKIAAILNHYAADSADYPFSNSWVFPSRLTAEERRDLSHLASNTNAQGVLLDAWQTPLQVETRMQTDVVIRSAGPNRIFIDKDDIVYDGSRTNFVRP